MALNTLHVVVVSVSGAWPGVHRLGIWDEKMVVRQERARTSQNMYVDWNPC